MSLILVLNCGSSSLKFAIIDSKSKEEKLSGLAECFNLPDARIKWKLDGKKQEANLGSNAAHFEALKFIVDSILASKPELAQNLSAIGHRLVHGGEKFTSSVIITDEVIRHVQENSTFAPLHNPAGLIGIAEAYKAFPHLKDKNVGVFDTAFHQTMPESAYLYAIPYHLYTEKGIRRYGFHGTSHYYITQEAAKALNKPVDQVNIISCHLGNGASVTAVKNGKSVDTSMGLTPLEGLVMGTRSGDIDPAIVFYCHDQLKMSVQEINDMLTKESGLMGLTQTTSDCRFAEDNYGKKDEATRALDVFSYRLAKYIAGYSAALDGRLDAIVFTGGIGENSSLIRTLTLERLGLLGIAIDAEANNATRFGKSGLISKPNTCPVMVITTNEELVIAQDTAALI
ncbi:acetate kinase A and propionate kinase 2 [Gammaproteobacteria bacterium]|nr:acetate kinase A and propionate kinase 2 [Gammaproteobacteria bacterium]